MAKRSDNINSLLLSSNFEDPTILDKNFLRKQLFLHRNGSHQWINKQDQ